MGVTPDFWRDRRVLLTGHTGFKGAWLALWLERLGAQVSAFALPPATQPSLFSLLAPWPRLDYAFADLVDERSSRRALARTQPEIVFHLAAQALVRPAYANPVATFETNVLGTIHLLEALRRAPSVRVCLVVTSDDAYANELDGRPFREGDALGGKDPYSASKACQELVAASYGASFLAAAGVRVATARAGNVIGGGDWAVDRLVPDFIRAISGGNTLRLRHPEATRPWQHVFDPLAGYLMYAERLYAGEALPDALNFGPPAGEVRTVSWLADQLVSQWGRGSRWERGDSARHLPEAMALTLDPALAQSTLGWRQRYTLEEAVHRTVAWYRAHADGRPMRAYSLEELDSFQSEAA
jgi:CDP-glucose 4,6-dehydratase